MQIPGAERALVDPFKVLNYLLSFDHPVGRHKAVFFATLGYHRANWHEFAMQLQQHALRDSVALTEETPFGDKYVIARMTTGPNGHSAIIVTVWIVRHGETFPRLVTAYPGRTR